MKFSITFLLLLSLIAADASSSSASSFDEPIRRGKPALRATYKHKKGTNDRLLKGRGSRRKGSDDTHEEVEERVEVGGKKKTNAAKAVKQKKGKNATSSLPEEKLGGVVSRTTSNRVAMRSSCSTGTRSSINDSGKGYDLFAVGPWSGCTSDNDCQSGCCCFAHFTGFQHACLDVTDMTNHVLDCCKKDSLCDKDEELDVTNGLN
mmetsp:Transcript_48574/g.146496  ORF Transcript_48574/g.146496 Transcript_48574/m.146496 type:complete len:205 (-) Transcript_48574:129-743(-)